MGSWDPWGIDGGFANGQLGIDSRPVVTEGQVVVRETLYLSLTFDHRIIDGAPAARFLQSLGQRIENPSPWLVG